MKIIGFVYHDGERAMLLKGDSCMLNGRKPMFVPDWTSELGVTLCIVLRVSRLGKEIEARFADRYYDAVAPGADFAALDLLRVAREKGDSWTQATGFDFSLAIGEWVDKGEWRKVIGESLLMSPEEAIAEASKWMTIRQGDLIYIQAKQDPQRVEKEEIIRVEIDGQEKLYCKIK